MKEYTEEESWRIIRAALEIVRRLEIEEVNGRLFFYDEQVRAFIAAHPKNEGKKWFYAYGHDNKGKGIIVQVMAEHSAEALKAARIKRPDCKFNHCNMKKKKFAKAVNKEREAKYMTQKELGKRVGTSQTTISFVEAGKSTRAPLFLRICKFLGLDPKKFWLW